MSMNHHSMEKCLSADDAFAVTLLVTCEATKNILIQRSAGNKKRLYWLNRLDEMIEAVNRTYDGYLPDKFHEKAKKYHRMIEVDMNNLLKAYKED